MWTRPRIQKNLKLSKASTRYLIDAVMPTLREIGAVSVGKQRRDIITDEGFNILARVARRHKNGMSYKSAVREVRDSLGLSNETTVTSADLAEIRRQIQELSDRIARLEE